MKRIRLNPAPVLIAILVLVFAAAAKAQTISSYSFAQSMGAFKLAGLGASQTTSGTAWDNTNFPAVPLPFPFTYHGTVFTNVIISPNGFARLGPGSPAGTNGLWPLNADLYGLSANSGDVTYATTGQSPGRIFTIQWSNWGIYPNGNNEFSFQIKLYETSNKIQYVYKNGTAAGAVTVYVGMSGATTADCQGRTTTTNWSATTATTTVAASTCTISSMVRPTNGLTFTWTSAATVAAMGFSQSTTTYVPVEAAASYSCLTDASASVYDDVAFPGQTLPFTFFYGAGNYTTIVPHPNGFVQLGSSAGYSYSAMTSLGNVLSPLNANLYSLPSTAGREISVATIGTSPNRTYVVQWINWGAYPLGLNEFSFQIRLQETTNTVQFVYGSAPGINSGAAYVGLSGATSTDYKGRNNNNAASVWTATTAATTNTTSTTTGPVTAITSSVRPVSGLAFTWTPPPPVISSFSPGSGPAGTSVVITGTNFNGATAVTFGGTSAASYVVNSSTQITAIVGTGTIGTIAVTTPYGTATSAGIFTFPVPTISSFTPDIGSSGTPVVITGTNFSGATAVTFGGTSALSYVVNSSTQITAIVGAVTTGTIAVTTPYGTVNSAGIFTNTTPMYYVSSNTIQMNDGVAFAPGSFNKVILQIQVVTTEGVPFDMTSMSFSTASSTSPSTDILHASVHYTGTSSSFYGSSPQFGASVYSPGSSIYFSGTQMLQPGTNYFWLVYDLKSGANLGDNLDACCNSLVMSGAGGTHTPATSCPAGHPYVDIYCNSLYTSGCSAGDNINTIAMADLPSLVTGCTGGTGFANYIPSFLVHFLQGLSYPFTITSSSSAGEYAGVWIDFNDNGSLGDAGEFIGGTPTASSSGTITGNVTISATAALGYHRMRVRLVNGTVQSLGTSCTTYSLGETHDYKVLILPPAPAITAFSPTSGCAGTGLVIITGTNFTGATAVKFGGTNALSYVVNSATQITATVGAGATGTISVTTPSGTGTSAGTFTVNLPPSASISYTGSPYCPGGTAVVLLSGTSGGTYAGDAGLIINGSNGDVNLSASSGGLHTVTYVVPAGGGCSGTSSTTSLNINSNGQWLGLTSNWNSASNWCGGVPTISSNVLIPSTSNNPHVLSGNTAYVNNISLATGSVFVDGGGTLNLYGNVTLSPTGSFDASGGTVNFAGSSAQNILPGFVTGTLMSTGGGNKTLNGNITAVNNLTLTNGNIMLNGNDLILQPGATITGGSAASYVKTTGAGSELVRQVGATPVIFPVGNTNYNPVTMNNNGTTDNFRIHVRDEVLAGGPTGMQVDNTTTYVINHTFDIEEDVLGGSLANITLQWNAGEENTGLFQYNHAYIAHFYDNDGAGPNPAEWHHDDIPYSSMAPAAGGWPGAGPYTATTSNVTTFSPFAIGSNGGSAPLHVQLTDVSAVNEGARNRVEWHSAVEDGLDHYEVERSTDGQNFSHMVDVAAAGHAFGYLTYDNSPNPGLTYYRLKLVEQDGTSSYSQIVHAFMKVGNNETVMVYPNPVTDVLQVEVFGVSDYASVVLTDLSGKVIGQLSLNNGKAEISMDHLASGLYFVKFTDGPVNQTIKVNKQ